MILNAISAKKHYIGETARTLECRLCEHCKQPLSVINEHLDKTSQSVSGNKNPSSTGSLRILIAKLKKNYQKETTRIEQGWWTRSFSYLSFRFLIRGLQSTQTAVAKKLRNGKL